MDEHRCQEHIFDGGGRYRHQCTYKGKVERDGKWYCGIHDPVARAERDKRQREKRHRQWQEMNALADEREAQHYENERKLAAFPALVEALESIIAECPDPQTGYALAVVSIAQVALTKAKRAL